MKLLISLKSLNREYTGTFGFYASVSPKPAQALRLLEEFRSAPFKLVDASDLHVTLMYSKVPVPLANVDVDTRNTFKAKPLALEYWEGHDKEGYVVLKLKSSQLQERHNFWKSKGAKHSFDEYSPHITIGKDVGKSTPAITEFIRVANTQIIPKLTPLLFTNESIEDLKP